jgi:hypothetical protein
MAEVFHYQALTQPLLPPAAPTLPDLSWLPVDARPHRDRRAPESALLVVLQDIITELRVSQIPVELAFAYAFPLVRVSQLPVEILTQYATAIRQARVSQIALEIAYPFQCPEFRPPLPAACPVAIEPGPTVPHCADDAPPFFPVE